MDVQGLEWLAFIGVEEKSVSLDFEGCRHGLFLRLNISYLGKGGQKSIAEK
jgi:hypothetical protein